MACSSRIARSTMSKQSRKPGNPDDFLLPTEYPHAAETVPERPSSIDELVRAAIDEVFSPSLRERLSGQGFALIVKVPSDAWGTPVRQLLQDEYQNLFCMTTTERRTPIGESEASGWFASGASVVGITERIDLLPKSLVRTADATISLRLPTGPTLGLVIATVTGKTRVAVADDLGTGLDLLDAAAAIRPSDKPEEAAARLRSAQSRLSGLDDFRDAPPLESLHGYGAAMTWARDLVDDVAAYRDGKIPWEQARASALLASSPGLGKTSLFRSLARTLHAPLVATSVSDWFTSQRDPHLGTVLKSVKESHQLAARLAQSTGVAIWLIDEIDALPSRCTTESKNRDFWAPLIAEVLCLLDGAISSPGLIVAAATNHPGNLDPALVRPGRLSRTIWIGLPDADAIVGILRTHLREDLVGADLTGIARLAVGMTGAVIAAAVVEARAIARRAGRALRVDDLSIAIAPADNLPEALRWRVAVHEAGHAIAALSLGISVHAVSTVSVGAAGGYMISRGAGSIPTRDEIEKQVMVSLAGRAAEELILGAASGGAAQDLKNATRALVMAQAQMGLGTRLVSFEGDTNQLFAYDPRLVDAVDASLRELYLRTFAIVERHSEDVKTIATKLLARRVLSGAEIVDIVNPTATFRASQPRYVRPEQPKPESGDAEEPDPTDRRNEGKPRKKMPFQREKL